MNKIFISLLFIFTFLMSFSQDCFQASKTNWGNDSLECRKNVSLYSEFMKQKVFADAAIFWTKTQNYCPKYKPNLYANGAYIYKNIIKTKKKEKSSQVNLYFDSLYLVYDQWILNFGICDEIKAAVVIRQLWLNVQIVDDIFSKLLVPVELSFIHAQARTP